MKNTQRVLSILCLGLVSFFVIPESRAQERATRIAKAKCNESRFTPCVCASKVPTTIQYRPALAQCGGRAAAILSGTYRNSYSIVLRDRENRDRFPPQGFQGCSPSEVEAGLNKCSAYKVQDIIRTKKSTIHCFGAAGTAKVLAKATRLTIKLKDVPGSNTDPLVRICLNGFSPKKELN